MQNYNHLKNLAILGLISGLISWAFAVFDESGFGLLRGPGLVFGIFIAGYFYFKKIASLSRIVLWFFVSYFSYFLMIYLFTSIESAQTMLFVCGFLGAILVLAGARFLIYHIKYKVILYTSFLGGFFSFSSAVLASQDTFMILVFTTWQAVVAGGIGYALDRGRLGDNS